MRSDAFADYWSSIIGKLRKSNPAYREMEKQIGILYEQFPKVQSVLDSDKSCNLTEEECGALLQILTVQSRCRAGSRSCSRRQFICAAAMTESVI